MFERTSTHHRLYQLSKFLKVWEGVRRLMSIKPGFTEEGYKKRKPVYFSRVLAYRYSCTAVRTLKGAMTDTDPKYN